MPYHSGSEETNTGRGIWKDYEGGGSWEGGCGEVAKMRKFFFEHVLRGRGVFSRIKSWGRIHMI